MLPALLRSESALVTLDLSYNALGSQAMRALGKGLEANTALKELYLQHNKALLPAAVPPPVPVDPVSVCAGVVGWVVQRCGVQALGGGSVAELHPAEVGAGPQRPYVGAAKPEREDRQ